MGVDELRGLSVDSGCGLADDLDISDNGALRLRTFAKRFDDRQQLKTACHAGDRFGNLWLSGRTPERLTLAELHAPSPQG